MSVTAKASTPFAAANKAASVLTRSVISPDCSPKVSVRQSLNWRIAPFEVSPSFPAISKQLRTATQGWPSRWIVVVRLLGDQRLRRQDQAGDGGRIANRAVADLDRIDDAGLDEIDGCAATCIEAVAVLALSDLRHLCFTIQAGIGGNIEKRTAQRALKQLRPLFGTAFQFIDHAIELRRYSEQRDTATRHDTFLDRRTGRIDRVLDQLGAALLLDRRRATRKDHGRATGQLGDPLLEFVALNIFRGRIVLAHDLLGADGDFFFIRASRGAQRIRWLKVDLAREALIGISTLFLVVIESCST